MLLDLVRDSPPTAELVTVDQLKAHLRVESDDFDSQIEGWRAAAMGHLDGYAGILGRALAAQTWVLYLDRFPSAEIRLPLPPLIAVDSITYLKADGVRTTLAASAYQVLDGELARVLPAFDTNWPPVRITPRAVAITFTCGWEELSAGVWPAKLQPVIAAIKLMVENDFDGGDPQRADVIKSRLRPLRVLKT